MRAFVLLSALVLAMPMGAAGDAETDPDVETECVPVFIDALPPNEVSINPPCAAENIASLMPVGSETFLCTFYSVWSIVAAQQMSGQGAAVVRVQGAAGCVTG